MNEREKIIESIKKGILSAEEGLDLLESLGLQDPQPKEAAVKPEASEEEESEAEDLEEPVEDTAKESFHESEPEINPAIEASDQLARNSEVENKMAEAVETQEASEAEEIGQAEQAPEEPIEQEEPQLGEEFELESEEESEDEETGKNPQSADSVASMIDEWENTNTSEPVEEDPVRSKIDEFDHALQTKIETLREKKEAFRELRLEAELGIISEENSTLYQQMEVELKELEEEIELLKHERNAVDKDFFATLESPHVSEGFFEVPDDFEEQKYRPIDRPQVQPNDLGSRIGRMVNKAAKTVSDTVNNDFDLKKINQKFYGTSKTHFSHQFTFEEIDARSIDIKLAKGKVILKTWEDETINDVKVEASVALLGQMPEADPMEAFLERSQIDVNSYQILFHVPNKRVEARLIVHLPKRQYNDLSIRLLNGDLMIDELAVKNAAIKATNGTILFKKFDASMLELEGTNNDIEIREGQILDALVETVTGTIISKADVQRSEYSIINGEIKVTAGNADLRKIQAHSVNGDVKVSLPRTVGIEGTAKTGVGTINYRFANCETVQERNGETQKVLHFQRAGEETAQIDVSSKAGNIFLKDNDK